MRFRRWAAVLMTVLVILGSLPVTVFAESPGSTGLSGALGISGKAFVGGSLEADLTRVTPQLDPDTGVSYEWCRETEDAEGRLSYETVGSTKQYQITEADLGLRLRLVISASGEEGTLSVFTIKVQETEAEADSFGLQYTSGAMAASGEYTEQMPENGENASSEGMYYGEEQGAPAQEETYPYSENGAYTGAEPYPENGAYTETEPYPENGAYTGTEQYPENEAYTGQEQTPENGEQIPQGTEYYYPESGEENTYTGDTGNPENTQNTEYTQNSENTQNSESAGNSENGLFPVSTSETYTDTPEGTESGAENPVPPEGTENEAGNPETPEGTASLSIMAPDGITPLEIVDFGTITLPEEMEALDLTAISESWPELYPERQYFRLVNTGSQPLSFAENAPVSFAVGDVEILEPGESAELFIQPRDGTEAGTYLEDIVYQSLEGAAASFQAEITVRRAEEGEELLIPPAEPTQAPEVPPVEEPAEPTQPPAEPTQVPAEPTQAPAEPTQTPEEVIVPPVEEPAELTTEPTQAPAEPTAEPTQAPAEPTAEPTQEPAEPTAEPTQEPAEPTAEPTQEPAEPTAEPTQEPEGPASISVTPPQYSFEDVTEGYTVLPNALTVTVTNTGKKTVNLQNVTAENFTVSAFMQPELPEGESAMFIVQPKADLKAGSYAENLAIYDQADPAKPLGSVLVKFTVKEKEKISSLSLTPMSVVFDSRQEGYPAPADSVTVTVTNTGNQNLTVGPLSHDANTSAFVVSGLSQAFSLVPGGSAAFTVSPKAGLAANTYQETLTIPNSANLTASVSLVMMVTKSQPVLKAVYQPAAITGIPFGAEKTDAGLKLPATVGISTSKGDTSVGVIWNTKDCPYVQWGNKTQTFQVSGTAVIPGGIIVPPNVSTAVVVNVTVNGRNPIKANASENYITGITSNGQYTTETKISFTAVGSRMNNTDPVDGDTRFIPSVWNVQEDRVWTDSSFTSTFRISRPGDYMMKVTFAEEQYQNGKWVKTGITDSHVQVPFRVVNAVNPTITPTDHTTRRSPVLTGDPMRPVLFAGILAVAAAVIIAILVYRRKSRK